MNTQYTQEFLRRLEEMKELNRTEDANHPLPSKKMLVAFIQLFWAADMAEGEIRAFVETSNPK